MELRKIGKKGQLTIPRSVLRAAGMAEDAHVSIEATSDGAIVMRPVTVYLVETYSNVRVREFEQADTLPAAMERRVQAYLKGKCAKK